MGRLLEIAKAGSTEAVVRPASASEHGLGVADRLRLQAPADAASHPEASADLQRKTAEAEGRFGQPHAKLFPFIGRKVRTPEGPGTLLQVFADRVSVVLDSERSRCSFFPPGRVEPVSWEVHE
jgi:hypothetical protein